MKIFLAGSSWDKICWANNDFFDFNRLESFFYIKDERKLIHKYKSFLLDSGAFTFMNQQKGKIDWHQYIENYANFINTYKVNHFFELDIDSIVGIYEVEKLRNKLELLTGKQCIPVWHKSRGLEYWKKMTKEYNYVAIGGIVTKEIKKQEYNMFTGLLQLAKKEQCKVHALGFTNVDLLKKYPFYSVDSTTWLSGNRFGRLYKFTGDGIADYKKSNCRVNTVDAAINNFNEWIRFSKYAEIYL